MFIKLVVFMLYANMMMQKEKVLKDKKLHFKLDCKYICNLNFRMFHIAHKKNDEKNLMTYHHKL